MEIKLIIFDLDGVLVDSRRLHYEAFNAALKTIDEKYIITEDEHKTRYDGNSTTQKLKFLTEDKNLPTELYNQIWQLKQQKTVEIIDKFTNDNRIINILKELKDRGYKIYCASNSIWNTIKIMLMRKGFLEYFDFFISNEDVAYPKPNPEIYLKCINRAKLSPKEVLILEDSPIGRRSAQLSGCYLCPIENPNDVTIEKINEYIDLAETKNENL
jgi:HAD superfamily hydrolase (TIGR01509 family)